MKSFRISTYFANFLQIEDKIAILPRFYSHLLLIWDTSKFCRESHINRPHGTLVPMPKSLLITLKKTQNTSSQKRYWVWKNFVSEKKFGVEKHFRSKQFYVWKNICLHIWHCYYFCVFVFFSSSSSYFVVNFLCLCKIIPNSHLIVQLYFACARCTNFSLWVYCL